MKRTLSDNEIEIETRNWLKQSADRQFFSEMVDIFERGARVYPLVQNAPMPDHDVRFTDDISEPLRELFAKRIDVILGMFWPEGFSVVRDATLKTALNALPPTSVGSLSISSADMAEMLKNDGLAYLQQAIAVRNKPR